MATNKIGTKHTNTIPGPEPTSYDRNRHESMKLRQNGMYGIPKIFMAGLAKPKPRCVDCGRLVYWCDCEKSK